MRFASLDAYIDSHRRIPPTGPLAIILSEDGVEVETTLRHHLAAGFAPVLLLATPDVVLDASLSEKVVRIDHDTMAENALVTVVNRVNDAFPDIWLYYCFNAEYLFFPFCESRSVREMLAFHAEERRNSMLTYVVDLYAGNLATAPNAVSLDDAHLDRSGYYALARNDPDRNWQAKERQLDFYGGLRWRFEEHVPWTRRKIDRISIFRTRRGLELHPDFTFNDDEMNTYACPWHNNLTAAVCSFRTAKALKSNPGSRYEISNFRWHNSTEFEWHSQQLMDFGLMEPGQWF